MGIGIGVEGMGRGVEGDSLRMGMGMDCIWGLCGDVLVDLASLFV